MTRKHLLYLVLSEERHEDGVIKVVSSDRCAVFDEEKINNLSMLLRRRQRDLEALRKAAETHSSIISERFLVDLAKIGVQYKIKKFVQKKC